MGYLTKFEEEITNLLKIETPLIWINTREEEIAEKAVVHIAAKMGVARYYYYISNVNGSRMDPVSLKESTAQNTQDLSDMFSSGQQEFDYKDRLVNCLDAMSLLRDAPDSVMLIMRAAEDVFGNTQVQRMIFDHCCRKIHKSDVYHPIIMIVPSNNVPPMLTDFTTTVELPLMSKTDNFKAICSWIKKHRYGGIKKEDAINAAKAATGLTTTQMLHALDDSWNRTNSLNVDIINNIRVDIIKQSGTLTYVQPKKTLDSIGGHKQLKAWIKDTKKCMTQEAAAYGIKPAKGYLALGPAGTGKTAMAEAIANYLNEPLIIFDLSKVMGGIVGQSEQTARRAFETINSVGKCVVLIDEADKQLAGAGKGVTGVSDGGTIMRVFDVILQNLQNNKDQFYIMTTNDISKLPAPLMRAGRLDTKWFFSFPTEEERKDIFRIYFSKAKKEVPDSVISYAARLADHFTGAEIETAVNNILRISFLDSKPISNESVLEGIDLVSPVFKTNREEIDELFDYVKKNHIPLTDDPNKKSNKISEASKKRMGLMEEALDENFKEGA